VRVGFCGRLEPYKGVLEILEAAKRCRESTGAKLQLEFLGAGSLSSLLEEEARNHDWIRVRCPVPHADVAAFLRALDIFVLPSLVLADHQEHDAHALLEALAVGLPVIGSRSGIIPEIVEQASGLLVDPGCVDALADAIGRLVANPELRQAHGARGREAALRSFSLPFLASLRASVYDKVLQRS
jgi:glycosyltransferase involved in cell wall biosynthesis